MKNWQALLLLGGLGAAFYLLTKKLPKAEAFGAAEGEGVLAAPSPIAAKPEWTFPQPEPKVEADWWAAFEHLSWQEQAIREREALVQAQIAAIGRVPRIGEVVQLNGQLGIWENIFVPLGESLR